MSLPWEPDNIVPNLGTLARLRRDDHLSVLKEGNTEGESFVQGIRGLRAHFKIEGKIRQSFVRSKKGGIDSRRLPQKATTVPIGNFPNKRTSMGVCWQFHRDGTEGTGIFLRGARSTCSKEDLKGFYRWQRHPAR